MKNYQSWGRISNYIPQQVYTPQWIDEIALPDRQYLCYGNGRSYGDSCHITSGTLIDTSSLTKFIAFNDEIGIVRCESGVQLTELLRVCIPKGWFLPVTPGTKFVTIGGAIANDVHGKNHHKTGSFGNHVLQFELLRSTGERFICSPLENFELFSATIGGLGLTGIILWAEIQFRKIQSPFMLAENIKFGNFQEFLSLSSQSDKEYEYSVSWIDSTASAQNIGRGVFLRGNHDRQQHQLNTPEVTSAKVVLDAPSCLLNKLTIKMFNTYYYNKQSAKSSQYNTTLNSFFYPLDTLTGWNKLYGKHGFYQYQCVVPFTDGSAVIQEILTKLFHGKEGSFLAVLKTFGTIPALGMLSFPRPGITLALDFSNKGIKTLKLLEKFDAIVREAGGVVYPAKDARMSSESFKYFYPQWEVFSKYIDPKFTSDFWRRVTAH